MIAHEFFHLILKSATAILLEKLPDSTAVSSGEGEYQHPAAELLHLDTECNVFIFIRLIGKPGILLHILINKGSIGFPQGLPIKRV